MLGVLMSILAGAAMSVQGVVNTRLSDRTGLLESNVFVQGTAFVLALIACVCFGKGDLAKLREVNWIYRTGGILGLVITLTVMLGIGRLSPTYAISIILISQLLVAALIDAFGLLGSEKAAFTWPKWVGLAAMIGGVLIFRWPGKG